MIAYQRWFCHSILDILDNYCLTYGSSDIGSELQQHPLLLNPSKHITLELQVNKSLIPLTILMFIKISFLFQKQFLQTLQ